MLLILLHHYGRAGCALLEGLSSEAHLGEATELTPDHMRHWPQRQAILIKLLPWYCCWRMHALGMLQRAGHQLHCHTTYKQERSVSLMQILLGLWPCGALALGAGCHGQTAPQVLLLAHACPQDVAVCWPSPPLLHHLQHLSHCYCDVTGNSLM